MGDGRDGIARTGLPRMRWADEIDSVSECHSVRGAVRGGTKRGEVTQGL